MMTANAWADFSNELDTAIAAHVQWSHRILRYAILHTAPDTALLDSNAHEQCLVGRCFSRNRIFFDALDAPKAQALDIDHRQMHAAIRAICGAEVTAGAGRAEHLLAFESAQIRLIEHLTYFKTLATQIHSHIDPLTGLALRHDLEQKFQRLQERCRREGNAVAIMIIDVDHFKSVNDRYGHIGGDLVLKGIAQCLKSSLRDGDEAFRYGGDELLALLELRASSEAIPGGQRLLNTIRELSVVLHDGTTIQTTATIGIAQAQGSETIAEVLQRADTALYRGKENGRDCYVLAAASD